MRANSLFIGLLVISVGMSGCASEEQASSSQMTTADSTTLPNGLLVALAALDKDADGKPVPLPARLGILTLEDGDWQYRFFEDSDSNVFHKAMAWRSSTGRDGVLTFGGSQAIVKLWSQGEEPSVLWEEDFGGKFSRMRDAEIADVFGEGSRAIAIGTHDQGVVAVLRPGGQEGFDVVRLDEEPSTFVHEIEVGDLDGDGALEIYATPSAPNKLDGTAQPGKVVRYQPALGEGRVVVADLGDRHAKEILVTDIDGDGKDELYVSVEAVSGGRVEIRRFDHGTDPSAGEVIVELDDTLCRFLTAGDIDGDGQQELVAATYKSGIWLLRPDSGQWSVTLIDEDSSGFEHAAILTDLDEDGVDELYVASDKHDEIRRYRWQDGEPIREVIYRHTDGLSRFTWNLTSAPLSVLP